jgi:hypothetical protein
VLIVDDVDLIIATMEDASEDILQRHGVKQEMLYERIEKELKEIQQAIHSSVQYLLRLLHWKLQNWGTSPPSYED